MSTCVAVTRTVALKGLEGIPVSVETHTTVGLVSMTLVGLADTALRESKDRVRAAISSCGIAANNRRVTVSLSPASLPKTGSSFDLAIAISILISRGIISQNIADNTAFVAELGLDGTLRMPGSEFALVWGAKKGGFSRVVVAAAGWEETQIITGIEVIPCQHLLDLIECFSEKDYKTEECTEANWERLARHRKNVSLESANAKHQKSKNGLESESGFHTGAKLDLRQIRGQEQARFSLELAAAGGHHILLYGDPGTGKTMLAKRLSSILPPLDIESFLDLAALRSIAGLSVTPKELDLNPPSEVLHSSSTVTSLIGGGNGAIRPGAISLATGGVLILDEAPEFHAAVLEALRLPLEEQRIVIRRSIYRAEFPAKFQLVMTANPCPCGRTASPESSRSVQSVCSCSPLQRRRYKNRLSAPLLDRVDIHQEVLQPHGSDFTTEDPEDSESVRQRVVEARARSIARWSEYGFSMNSEIPGNLLRNSSNIPISFTRTIDSYVGKGMISLRAADKILRIAWTIADLNNHPTPTVDDLSEAIAIRSESLWVG